MPIFGEYETVDEPVWITEERAFVATVWKARRRGTVEEPAYALKCFAPRRQGTSTGETSTGKEALDADRGLEFLEAVKLLKKAEQQGGTGLAAIHAFGTSDLGAWYATDYCPRKSLKEYVRRQGGVEPKALEHVVASIVGGCLALQRATGRSHGNLKASNVLLVGQPQLLRKTPLQLVDPRPTALLLLVDSERERPIQGNPKEVTEARDLRGIGEIILQLVEGRSIENAYDYNYPVGSSAAWNRLGTEGERWRHLCNRLLNPQLSLAELNLESLAKDFRPSGSQGGKKLVLGASVAALALVALGGIYFWNARPDHGEGTKSNRKTNVIDVAQQEQQRRTFDDVFDKGSQAAQRTEWAQAVALFSQALPIAQTLKDPDRQQRAEHELAFSQAMDAAQRAFDREAFVEAKQYVEKAKAQKPTDSAVTALVTKLDERLRKEKVDRANALWSQAQDAERGGNWGGATNYLGQVIRLSDELSDPGLRQKATNALEFARSMFNGYRALETGQEEEAVREADKAALLRPDHLAPKNLKASAKVQQEAKLITRTTDQNKAQLATTKKQASDAARKKDWSNAAHLWTQALSLADALKDAGQVTEIRSEQAYAKTMSAGEAFFAEGKFREAIAEMGKVLVDKKTDPDATELRNRASKQLADEEDRKRKHDELVGWIAEAQQAVRNDRWPSATNLWGLALRRAEELKDEPRRKTAATELDYSTAMEAASRHLAAHKPDDALKAAERALALKPIDSIARNLKAKAQREKEQIDTEAKQKTLIAGMAEAAKAVENRDWTNAVRLWSQALPLTQELNDAVRRRTATNELAFAQAMQSGEELAGKGKWGEAKAQFETALLHKQDDRGALERKQQVDLTIQNMADSARRQKLKDDAEDLLMIADTAAKNKRWPDVVKNMRDAQQKIAQLNDREWESSVKEQLAYAQAMDSGQKALAVGNFTEAKQFALEALKHRNPDPAATQLANAADAGGREALRKELDSLLVSSRDAIARTNWTAATNVLSQAVDRARALNDSRLQTTEADLVYARGMDSATRLFNEGSFDLAGQELNKLLVGPRANDAAGRALQKQLRMEKERIATANQAALEEQKYRVALDAAKSALDAGRFEEAIQQASVAQDIRKADTAPANLKAKAQAGLDLGSASDAFKDGNYEQALRLCQAHPTDPRFDNLAQQVTDEQKQLAALEKAFKEGSYDSIARTKYPAKPLFQNLTRQAGEEQREFAAAKQKLNRGEYDFIPTLETRAFTNKPPVAELLATARRERDELTALQGLQSQGDKRGVRERLDKLGPEVRQKRVFAELVTWSAPEVRPPTNQVQVVTTIPRSGRQPVVDSTAGSGSRTATETPRTTQASEYSSSPIDQGTTTQVVHNKRVPRLDPDRRETLLRHWESELGSKRLGGVTPAMKSFCSDELKQVEDAYKADGQLTNELKKRINRLRIILEGNSATRGFPTGSGFGNGIDGPPIRLTPGR